MARREQGGAVRVVWRCAGMRWDEGVPGLRWEGGRVSRLTYGQRLAFRAVGTRLCPGARGNPCPLAATVPGRATGGRCPECARLDRAHSVAADTIADDPRPYRVYLAWFGPGMTKVGITAEERGDARLLEQGAVAFGWLGRGPLMAARRTEEVLRHALKVPDRIPYDRKRAVRHALPAPDARRREIGELYERAAALARWTDTLELLDFRAYDHGEAFGLAGLPPLSGTVTELVDDGVVAGRLLAAAGPDLHLLDADGRCLALDTRVVRGWRLVAVEGGGTTSSTGDEGTRSSSTADDGTLSSSTGDEGTLSSSTEDDGTPSSSTADDGTPSSSTANDGTPSVTVPVSSVRYVGHDVQEGLFPR